MAILATAALTACSKTADAPPPVADPPAAADESATAAISQNVRSFTIGELPALSLRDGAMELPNDNKVFGVGRTPEEVAAVLAAAGQATDKLETLGQMYERHHVVPFQPTSENMVVYIAEKVKLLLPEHLELFSVRLFETGSSFAEWFASDN
jgi:hypothetical protein